MSEISQRQMMPMNQHTSISAWITFWFKCLFGFTIASLIYWVIWAAIGFGMTMFLAMLGAMVAGGAVQ